MCVCVASSKAEHAIKPNLGKSPAASTVLNPTSAVRVDTCTDGPVTKREQIPCMHTDLTVALQNQQVLGQNHQSVEESNSKNKQ